MNPESKHSYTSDYANREERRKNGHRGGFKLPAALPKKEKHDGRKAKGHETRFSI